MSETDSLQQLLQELNGKNKFPVLLNLAEKSRGKDINLSIACLDQAKEWIHENKINKDLFLYYKTLSGVQVFNSEFRKSLLTIEKADRIKLPEIEAMHYVDLYHNKNASHYMLGEFDKAQQANFKGLRIADSLQMNVQVLKAYNAIGNVYYSMDQLKNAEKYYLLAIKKAKEVDDKAYTAMSKGNMANLYSQMEKYEEAKEMLLECIAINDSLGAKQTLGLNYNNMAVIYYGQGQFERTLSYLKKSLAIAEEQNDKSSVANRSNNIGDTYLQLNDYVLAEKYLKIGLKTAEGIENKEFYRFGLSTAVSLYEKTGQFNKALAFQKKYAALNDSLLNESRIKVVAELEEKYDAEKKEEEIKNLSGENIQAQKKLKLFSNMIYWLCGSLLAFIMFFYFIRQNHKKNNIIQKKNLEIASDKIALLEQNKEITKLSSLIKGQEYERQRLAKELHDGLGGLLAISHSKLANLNKLKEASNVTIEESMNLVGDAYNQVRQISHNLMPLDLEKFGLITTLKNMISLVSNQNEINIDFRTYQFELALNNELGLNIYRIVQEAITNILKYAKAKNVLIELIQHEQHISLSIEDDGVGFDHNNISSGIGIQNMKNRSEILQGTFSLESKPKEGTSISVQIPIPLTDSKQVQT